MFATGYRDTGVVGGEVWLGGHGRVSVVVCRK
jgi:hypothetical protein